MSVFSANCFIWLTCPKLSGFVLSNTPWTPWEKFNQHRSRPHFTVETPTCKLKFRTTCTLGLSKNSIVVRGEELISYPYNSGHVNQTQQLALKTDMKPSWAEALKLCFLLLKIIENYITYLKIIIKNKIESKINVQNDFYLFRTNSSINSCNERGI
jgi:hypothetical protein